MDGPQANVKRFPSLITESLCISVRTHETLPNNCKYKNTILLSESRGVDLPGMSRVSRCRNDISVSGGNWGGPCYDPQEYAERFQVIHSLTHSFIHQFVLHSGNAESAPSGAKTW